MHITKIEFLKCVYQEYQFPKQELPCIAFAGRSNVGKSSVINSILKKKEIARTSSKPGKTISINYITINNKYYFVDLPGYGYATVSKKMREDWKQLIEQFIERSKSLKCIVLIIDLRHGLDDKDKVMIDWMKEIKIPFIIVATKADKLSNNLIHNNIEAIRKIITDKIPLVPYSSVNNRWTSTLWGEIDKYLLS
ncbi:YihA family ribosome biogenesis GTP-binding protein [bacterium]|nr:YihA family ribosome biogenesis GTP-binding protein [bacterium]